MDGHSERGGHFLSIYIILFMEKKILIKKSFIFCLILIITLFISSCASSKKTIQEPDFEDGLYVSEEEAKEIVSTEKETEAPEITDTFLGDFNPILIKNTVCLVKAGKKMKPRELSKTYLIPTNNNVEIHFRDLTNQVCIILNKAERDKLIAAANTFLNEYETKTISRAKINKKTAYYTSKVPVYFGLTGYSNGTDKCDFYANSEIFNKHAYFLLKYTPTRATKGEGFTPAISLYFSPTQLKDFLEILDQEYLNSEVEVLRKKAYTY